MTRLRLPIVIFVVLGTAALIDAWPIPDTSHALAQPGPHQPAPTLTIDLNFCGALGGRIPEAVYHAVTAHPEQVAGYRQACNPNRPPGRDNPMRNVLGLRNPNAPYHPLGNSLVWKCGCP